MMISNVCARTATTTSRGYALRGVPVVSAAAHSNGSSLVLGTRAIARLSPLGPRPVSSATPEPSSFPFQSQRTSGRKQKRLNRQRLRRIRALAVTENGERKSASEVDSDDDDDDDEVDDRTWRTILFPPVHDNGDGDIPREESMPWSKSPQEFFGRFRRTWVAYRGTWDGFFSHVARSTQDESALVEAPGPQKTPQERAKEVSDNVQQNLEFSREKGQNLKTFVQEQTGIHTMDDFKALTKEFLTVATLMVGEFMREYRKGRDEEVEKMNTEYFQDLDEEENEEKKDDGEEASKTRKRRRPKRRIPGLLS
ncbi:expressed unknown protein [Seminavis robusta]|uniref:Uncharacterized protein n=1 Tax=Seminavis robusta TaxID=568900 RepID=A0A9N8DZI4_9STRA|nr:expressed unknown protein [Seminavis robusta]|eukprot:Sro390_g133010.1 n/a (310) ;mRNA; r:69018-69947